VAVVAMVAIFTLLFVVSGGRMGEGLLVLAVESMKKHLLIFVQVFDNILSPSLQDGLIKLLLTKGRT
jgi:hypothetical protein